jgi:hypothetical protein
LGECVKVTKTGQAEASDAQHDEPLDLADDKPDYTSKVAD